MAPTPALASIAMQPLVVYKLGGSLLDLPDLANTLRQLLAQRPHTTPLLIVGGGPAADLVRRWDQTHGLGQEKSHWLALRAMRFNTDLLVALLPEAELVTTLYEVAAVRERGRLPLLDAYELLRHADGDPDALPHRWDVSSDAVAAWVAGRWQASEMVLCKSCELPDGSAIEAVQKEQIDAAFPAQAERLEQVSWCNLRSAAPHIQFWLPSADRGA